MPGYSFTMGILGQRQSNGWHQGVDATAAGRRPGLDAASDQTFPWDTLRWHTEIYLGKKGKLTPQEQDARLISLVQKHAAKDIAIAACGHAMTTQTIRKFLSSILSVVSDNDALLLCLHTILVAKRVNPSAVSDAEAYHGEALKNFLETRTRTVGGSLGILLPLLTADEFPPDTLLFGQIISLAQTTCAGFAIKMEELKSAGLWLSAYRETRWLASLSDKTAALVTPMAQAEKFLNTTFPCWRIWAAWQPDQNRLVQWGNFTNPQRTILRHILALEGPDFESRREKTLLWGIVSQTSGTFSSVLGRHNLNILLKCETQIGTHDMLSRTLSVVDAASLGKLRTNCSDVALPLLTQLIGRISINEATLQLLEGLITVGDVQVNDVVQRLLLTPEGPENMQTDLVLLLLRKLANAHCVALRGALASHLLDRISKQIQGMKSDFQDRLRRHHPWKDVALKILDFCHGIQQASWLGGVSDVDLQTILCKWPERATVCALADLRDLAERLHFAWLVKRADDYCGERLIQCNSVGASCLVDALVTCWQRVSDDSRRNLAVAVVQATPRTETQIFYRCLAHVPELGDTTVQLLSTIYQDYAHGGAARACVNFAVYLASESSPEIVASWRPLLRDMIKQQKATLIQETLFLLAAQPWLHWIACLGSVFSDVLRNPFASPAIPHLGLYLWAQHLSLRYLPTVRWLESTLGSGTALHCILTGGDDSQTMTKKLMQVLDAFSENGHGRRQPAMQAVIGHLASDGANLRDICDALSLLPQATADGEFACRNILALQKQKSRQVAAALSAGCLEASHLTKVDKQAVEALIQVLYPGVNRKTLSSHSKSMKTVTVYFEQQVTELMHLAARLDSLRRGLQVIDPHGTNALIAALDIKCSSLVDDALANLPAALVNVVEKVSEAEIEVQLPITHLTQLQRTSTGACDAQSLLIRLLIGDGTSELGFCIHLDSEQKEYRDAGHSPWMIRPKSSPPKRQFCHGRASRVQYKLSRILYRHLQRGFTSIEEVHTLMTKGLNHLADSCIVCNGARPGTKLRRATFCGKPECATVFKQTDPEIRLSDAWQDPTVVGLLLAMVYASAQSGNLALLPGCPVTEVTKITQLLNILPPKTDFAAEKLALTFKLLDRSTADLLSWTCCSYRGFLVSASGALRVPNLPIGTHQFVLANASPELEMSFAVHRAKQASKILFHGTSLDRLYAILCQGLRELSGTPLARHGAVHGRGIYMADEPSTSWYYANSIPTLGWSKSIYKNTRVLLGCEFAGIGQTPAGGIHVISDASMLMVRYIFLFPSGATAPKAADITPAMLSGVASLR